MGASAHGPESFLGRVIAGYHIERLLGIGASAAVFLGRWGDGPRRQVEQVGNLPVMLPEEAAVKVLMFPWLQSSAERVEFQRRFAREAATLQRLRSPHIVSVLAYGQDEVADAGYMIMPFLAGGSLADVLLNRRGPLRFAEVGAILTQLATALDYAHSQGTIHRDIKPANTLFDAHGSALLADFGIVRLLDDSATKLTSTGRINGTQRTWRQNKWQESRSDPPPIYTALGCWLTRW